MSRIRDIARKHGLSEEATSELTTALESLAGTTLVAGPDGEPLSDGVTIPPVSEEEPVAEAEDPTEERRWIGRYEDLGPLGEGGMGEVRRVRDPVLNRVMAMKILRPEAARYRSIFHRFVEEAQATAQLDHPGIIAVHELGQLPDGRRYFTMKEVRGHTLNHAIRALHEGVREGRWPDGVRWSFRRVIDVFRRVCEAVAHAHARGVIHRDLKPDNIMLGAYGEVLVVDWGLAKVLGHTASVQDDSLDGPVPRLVETDRTENPALRTRRGQVAGTPVYMSPEQARGENETLDARSDVWSLGAVLYHVLAGAPPFAIDTPPLELVERVKRGPPDAPPVGPAPIPDELQEICMAALSFRKEDRFEDAGVLGAEVAAWLEGVRARERALEVVAEAEAARPRVARLRRRSAEKAAEAEERGEGIRPWDPVEDKQALWALQDEARVLAEQAEAEAHRVTELLQAALTHAPDLPEAHALLADIYRERHEEAEEHRNAAAAARYERLIRAHDQQGRHTAYLDGHGHLVLRTRPTATVHASRYLEEGRRLVPESFADLGTTPLQISLPIGSFQLRVAAPGHKEIVLPVRIERLGEHRFERPGGAGPLQLPEAGALGPDDCFVPGGWFWAGGDPEASPSLARQRIWVDPFVIRRFPVTNQEYLRFLDDLVDQGREEEALRHAPRERSGADQQGALIYGRDLAGHFELRPDSDGDVWQLDWPVLLVTWEGANAYAAWLAEKTGRPWRLPAELEWEKAARGTDERFFPWGDRLDPTWACLRNSRPRPYPAAVDAFPGDESPYGVRGMAGGVIDWCADVFDPHGPRLEDGVAVIPDGSGDGQRVNRGGGWSTPPEYARAAIRRGASPGYRSEVLGFRVASSWSP